MRKDMKQVLIERPRRGSGMCYRDVRGKQNQIDHDDMPKCQGMRRPYGYDTKDFSDLLGPLKKFLRSCVGRPWNDVWSEICGQLSNNTVDAHLKGHVLSEVEVHTILVDGEVYSLGRFFRGMRPISGLYVDPASGLLTWREPPPMKRLVSTYLDGAAYKLREDGVYYPANTGWNRKRAHYPRKLIGFEEEAVKVNGIWYWVVFASVRPPEVRETPHGRQVTHHRAYDFVINHYVESGRYREGKRQMNSVDLRKHNLAND